MVLVDTSSWIHLLRPDGQPAARTRVEAALNAGTACWCPMIRLELWNGAGGSREKKVLRDLEKLLPELPITQAVWDVAFELARRAREAGITVPSSDLLIAACAAHYDAELETTDTDFKALASLTTP